MRDVAVIGVGMNKWGELWEKSIRTIFVESALEALDSAGVDHIDSMFIGCMSSGLFTDQEHLASLLSDYLGMNPVGATRVESACSSGGAAFRLGYIEVAAGVSDIVLVGGVEKMTDVDGGGATFALGTAADAEYESYHGATFPGLYALIARAHMERYGTTREQLASVAVKNHANGFLNPRAQFRSKITVDQVLNSSEVADPLRLLDCSPITDGAAAVILAPVEMAKKLGQPIIKILGSGQATDTIGLSSRADLTYLKATEVAAEKAYKQAGIGPNDIDFAEVHDCFTIAEICVTEALGFFEKGQAAKAAEAGVTARDGSKPINPSGGLKSKGHPVGATGVAQIVEIVEQLRGESGDRQIKNARRALAQNMGGTGGSTLVHILEVIS
ncbi:MAG: thiolase domain-containing protein [Candidatus Eisenbacteria bacterium]|uniref:Thiolase domain-containing protein n=1 Tax=Eiseniibacteriota bacterium TaxID=2212470 RepID=A0A948RUQ6_UNCEI|nr:thiolase domain-containing protein [Candidatus Eisenbacteria bacterium]MBU1947107.1 thiolase domain-containing protein [Candidatus Eisenbacteria bacterium]MBU2691353.1 thiolase domain-containing protein [Candidatus Eisenbacteria bacterium]